MSRRLPLYGDVIENHPPFPPDQTAKSEVRLFTSSNKLYAFVVRGSQIFDVVSDFDSETSTSLTTLLEQTLATHGPYANACSSHVEPPPLHSISLNVAQACNLSCVYCYADTGKFGGNARLMTAEVARAAADRLIAESEPGARLLLGFMGGEPLVNREVLHDVTHYAAHQARTAGKIMHFSLTTNGTLISRRDVELFTAYPFTVQISIDGGKQLNDKLRPAKNGTGSYECLIDALALFNRFGRPKHLSARVTVTPQSGALLPVLDELLELGFDEIGVAPVLVSPDPDYAFSHDDFELFLSRMVECGSKSLAEILAGRIYPFSNFITAMQEIHKGTHRPYPCGAGAGYLSANAEGNLFACHRLIDDPEFAMGSVSHGSDLEVRAEHLRKNHVDLMEPCRSCWARYLCGGGCYHEVRRRGRIACDYIRGWLEFCLKAYVELTVARPEWFMMAEDVYTRNDF